MKKFLSTSLLLTVSLAQPLMANTHEQKARVLIPLTIAKNEAERNNLISETQEMAREVFGIKENTCPTKQPSQESCLKTSENLALAIETARNYEAALKSTKEHTETLYRRLEEAERTAQASPSPFESQTLEKYKIAIETAEKALKEQKLYIERLEQEKANMEKRLIGQAAHTSATEELQQQLSTEKDKVKSLSTKLEQTEEELKLSKQALQQSLEENKSLKEKTSVLENNVKTVTEERNRVQASLRDITAQQSADGSSSRKRRRREL